MYKLNQIRDVHLELTSKCQARCPMCPRRINGGILNPLITLNEIDLETFKKWFSIDFIQRLDSLFMCGNLGDPIIARDCLEIAQYLRQTNPDIKLSMHTNGSARSAEWWSKLAKVDVRVVFGLDGLADTHSLYRIGTDFHKIIENAKAFIDAGGKAEWHMLVFKHNEHQVQECKEMSETLKFDKFQIKHTSRFVDNVFHALDETGKTTHVLQPTTKSKETSVKLQQNIKNVAPVITCKALVSKQIYVGANGDISPCCWLDFSWILPNQDSRIAHMNFVGTIPNLNTQSLEEVFNSYYFEDIRSTWGSSIATECTKQCGSFDKLGSQFEH
jgi:MoaA/NifB/PqqE/SkfB family radical SAM enzyme